MTVREIAKRFKVRKWLVYDVIDYIETVQGYNFKREGNRLVIDDKAYQRITKELERRGYYEKVKL